MITSSSSEGLNVQVLGLFSGTIHPLHMSPEVASSAIGKKIKARILWDIPGTEPIQLALSTLPHIMSLRPRQLAQKDSEGDSQDLLAIYPVGTILNDVKVARVDTDRGLFLQVADGLLGTVHVGSINPLMKNIDSIIRYLTSLTSTFLHSPARQDHTKLALSSGSVS